MKIHKAKLTLTKENITHGVQQIYTQLSDIFSLKGNNTSHKLQQTNYLFVVPLIILLSSCSVANEIVRQEKVQELKDEKVVRTPQEGPTRTPKQESEELRKITENTTLFHLLMAEENLTTQTRKVAQLKKKYGITFLPTNVFNTIDGADDGRPVLDRYSISSRYDKITMQLLQQINQDSITPYYEKRQEFAQYTDFLMAQVALILAHNKSYDPSKSLLIRGNDFDSQPQKKKFWDYILHLIQEEIDSTICNTKKRQLICIINGVHGQYTKDFYDRYTAAAKGETYTPSGAMIIEDPRD